ncbi:MAG: hypothetical protein Q8867_08040 [Bacteroidota bacterium]|nr:hypothetical protein [Bacteroidota bacterium]
MTFSVAKNKIHIPGILFFLLATVVNAQQPGFTFQQAERWRVPFSSGFEKALYKSSMDIGKNHLSGILLTKRMNDSTFRVVFANEVGMTYFDLEIRKTSAEVKSVFPAMDRKSFLSVLEQDFRMIFFRDPTIWKMKTTKDCGNDSTMIYQAQSQFGIWNYTLRCGSLDLLEITSSRKYFQKTNIRFLYGDTGIPAEIFILNPNIRHTFHLTLLSNQ